MCGYWNDRAPTSITEENLWAQYLAAIDKYTKLISNPESKIVFKMFTSGSYCDPSEIPESLQLRILTHLCEFPTVKEIVVESRPQYITETLMQKYRDIMTEQYFEIGVGLETTNDFIRTNVINKGFHTDLFKKAMETLHQFKFGVKAYLLFKPPFVGEYASVLDISQSIRDCVAMGVDTISVNPTNVQKNTICEELQKIKGFRSPWFYSLLWVLKNSLTQDQLTRTRIICDPSASGKERGVHNCFSSDPSNQECNSILHAFVQGQDLSVIPSKFEGECYEEFVVQLLLANK